MSGNWSRCGLRNWERVCQAERIESLDGDGQALEKKNSFSRVSRHLSQTPSDLRQELLNSGTHGAKNLFIYCALAGYT